MKNRNIIIAVLVILIAGGLWLLFRPKQQIAVFDSQAAVKQLEANDRSVGIEEYIKRNISALSTEAGATEDLGGTFQVTKLDAKNGMGSVSYEDGHNSFTADFKYTTDKKGLVTLTSFTVRK